MPKHIAVRFLRRGRPSTLTRRKAVSWTTQLRPNAPGKKPWVVGGPSLKASGAYPKAFGESMAKMALALSSGRST